MARNGDEAEKASAGAKRKRGAVATDSAAEAAANSSEIMPEAEVPAAQVADTVATEAAQVADVAAEPAATSAEPATPVSAPSVAAPAPSGGFGKAVIGGLVGAALAGGGLFGAVHQGFMTLPTASGASALTGLEQRLASAEKALGDLAARPVPQPDKGLDTRLQALETRAGQIEAAARQTDTTLKTFERALAETPKGAGGTAPAPVVDSGLAAQVETLRKDVEAARKQMEAGLGRIGEVETRLGTLQTQSKAGEGQQAALSQKLDGLESRAREAASAGKQASFVLAVQNVRTALDRGLPFATELAQVKGLAGPGPQIAVLEPLATNGLATVAGLRQRFVASLPDLQKAIPAASSASWTDMLMEQVQRVVSIRKVGDATGDDPRSVLTRIEARLARGDLAAAVAEIARLPEPVRVTGNAVFQTMSDRLGAEKALRDLAGLSLAAAGKN